MASALCTGSSAGGISTYDVDLTQIRLPMKIQKPVTLVGIDMFPITKLRKYQPRKMEINLKTKEAGT